MAGLDPAIHALSAIEGRARPLPPSSAPPVFAWMPASRAGMTARPVAAIDPHPATAGGVQPPLPLTPPRTCPMPARGAAAWLAAVTATRRPRSAKRPAPAGSAGRRRKSPWPRSPGSSTSSAAAIRSSGRAPIGRAPASKSRTSCSVRSRGTAEIGLAEAAPKPPDADPQADLVKCPSFRRVDDVAHAAPPAGSLRCAPAGRP